MSALIEKGPGGLIRGLRNLLLDMKREDVLEVLPGFTLEVASLNGFADSTDYDLMHEGKRYPPKAVFGLATKRLLDRSLTSDEFQGGEISFCFNKIKALGFEIVAKEAPNQGSGIFDELVRFQQYDREGIARIFEPSQKFTPGAGRWGMPGIVETPKDSGSFVLMVTLGKPNESNPYMDALTEDGYLIWESQTRHRLASPAIQKLLSHDPEENNIHLFLRSKTGEPYRYLGLLEYFSHDSNSSEPVHFIWHILNWDLGSDGLQSLGLSYRAALDPAYSPLKEDAVAKSLVKVEPPKTKQAMHASKKSGKKSSASSNAIDWAGRDERNRRLGLMGEKLVFQHEVNALNAAMRHDLAAQVIHVALTDSAAGYDVLSFDPDGSRKRIEVKTTQGPASTPFFISINEVLTSREDPESYRIYRVFQCEPSGDAVQFFELAGDVEESCGLVPVNFRAYPNGPSV